MSVAEDRDDLPKLEKYELLAEIGHGGMATVYKARDARLGREVAVKIIHRHLRENTEVATRFVAEARAAAKLKHPGIVEVHDVSSEDDRERYLVVELIRGPTLRKVLVDHRDMPAEIGASIVATLCDAVDHAHEMGIIHRDIKPENVLMFLPKTAELDEHDAKNAAKEAVDDQPSGERTKTVVEATTVNEPSLSAAKKRKAKAAGEGRKPPERSGSHSIAPSSLPNSSPSSDRASDKPSSARNKPREVQVKLTDFGIAKVLDAQGVTSTGQVLGSPAHMAPEQIEGGDITPKTDVFALGVLLYECLVGHLPFEGKNPAQVLRRVIEGTYAPADSERATVGGRFSTIVARALATDPAERTESPDALGKELRAELLALGISDAGAELTTYFRDPEAYVTSHAERIVPALVARGEVERKQGKVMLAASDFNRAHALAPSDVAILKRLSSLSSQRTRARLWKQGAVALAASLGLGLGTFGIVKLVRSASTPESQSPPTGTMSTNTPFEARPDNTTTSKTERIRATPQPTSSSRHMIPRIRLTETALTATSKEPRPVRFSVSPQGAKFELDGIAVEHFGKTFDLSPGPHSVSASPPKKDDPCCDAVSATVQVVPLDKENPTQAQTIAIKLKFRPATVRLVGAPDGASATCGNFVTVSAGGSAEAKLNEEIWTGACNFMSDGTTKAQTRSIRAGVANAINWPTE